MSKTLKQLIEERDNMGERFIHATFIPTDGVKGDLRVNTTINYVSLQEIEMFIGDLMEQVAKESGEDFEHIMAGVMAKHIMKNKGKK